MTGDRMPAGAPITTIPGLLSALRARIPQTSLGFGRQLITELRDGLEDAAEAYRSAGLSPQLAERRAVEDFGLGQLDRIAAECRTELGARATSRAAVVVGGGYALILGCWQLYYALFGSVTRFTNGTAAGNAFTTIGLITVVFALTTVGLLRYLRRQARSIRPVAACFAVLSLGSLLVTYLFAALSHRSPAGPVAGIVSGAIVEALSSVITGLMLWSIVLSICRSIPRSMSHPATSSGSDRGSSPSPSRTIR